ncbi:MAG: matrixin family metalloprotease [Pseudobdellovibrio sp.]
MEKRSIIGLALSLILCLVVHSCAPKKSNDCGFVQNVYGERIRWKTQFPIPIYVNSSMPDELKPAVHRAAATWESALGQKVFDIIEESSSSSNSAGRDRKNGIYFLPEWESDRKSEQGRTSVYRAGDEIIEADISINSANFVYYGNNQTKDPVLVNKNKSTAYGFYSFESLILHELGHLLGLKHREDGGTVMATYLASGVDRIELASNDIADVRCGYGK